jgi:hypothetical protein
MSHRMYDFCNIRGCSQNIPDWRCKIIKLTIRPIGRHHPRSSSLPHVHTGPTIPSFFGMLSGNPFLLECQALPTIRPRSPQWYQTGVLSASIHFLKYEEVTGCQIRGVRWVGDDSHFVYRQKLLGEDRGVIRGVVMVKQPGLFSPKFGATSSHVSKHSPQNVAVEPGIHSLSFWDWCFELPQLLCIEGGTSPEYFGHHRQLLYFRLCCLDCCCFF